MTTTIRAAGDTITIGKAFVSGKDRITVNNQMVFEGKLKPGSAEKFAAGSRHYSIEQRVTNALLSTTSTTVAIHEQGKLVHEGIYDQSGKPVASQAEAKAMGAVSACAMIGSVAGIAAAISLGMSLEGLPGGAVGGAIKGGVGGAAGAMIGYGIGYLLFGLRKKATDER